MKPFFRLAAVFFFITAGPLFPAGMFLDNNDLSPREKKELKNFESCRMAAQKGDAQAMGVLGLLYEKGIGTEKDPAQALKWLERGAKKGDAPAQNNLGFHYLKGKGVKQNNNQALRWFEKSAAQGLASAQENLGLIYGGGLGVKKNYETAFGYFKKAAEQNDSDAQTNLAILYSLGEGGPKDFIESYKWFTLALQHNPAGDELSDLRDNIEWLEKRMKGKDVAEAKKRVEKWKPSDLSR